MHRQPEQRAAPEPQGRPVAVLAGDRLSSAVSGPRTISTKLMRGTGLKKCKPAMRLRRRHGLAVAAMRSEDVLETWEAAADR